MKPAFHRSLSRSLIQLVLLACPASGLLGDEHEELQELREQIRTLEQKLRIMERKQELKDEAAAAAAKSTPKITVSDKGFALASADGANALKLRGLVQLDSRLYFDSPATNAFVLRRARLVAEGQFAQNYSFQLVTEFGGSSVSVVDANLGLKVSPALEIRLGRQKSPVGLELLQSDSWTFFNERSIVTNLVPNRDLGILASGMVLDGTLNYTAGILGGVADATSSNNSDFDSEKDFVGRLYYSPFKREPDSALQGLSFGISGSVGREKTAAGRTGGYKTDGQQTFFSYATATIADGRTWRVSPQFEYRHGPLGLLGEYVLSTVNVRPGATGPKAVLQNTAWQLAAGYVLTGENSSYNGVVPKTDFDPANGTWGAFEVVARYANLKIDDAAFPLYAATTTNADEVSGFSAGFNWYLAKAVVFKFDYYQTTFGLPPGAPTVPASAVLRQDEKALITRFQVAF